MDENDIRIGGIVYLRHMRFQDTNTIDYKMNGRPYLIYRIDKNNVYLFEIRSSSYVVNEFFYKITKRTKGGEKRECYVNLSNYLCLTKSELVLKANELLSETKFKYAQKMRFLTKEVIEGITERIKLLCAVEEYKQKMQEIMSISN